MDRCSFARVRGLQILATGPVLLPTVVCVVLWPDPRHCCLLLLFGVHLKNTFFCLLFFVAYVAVLLLVGRASLLVPWQILPRILMFVMFGPVILSGF